MILQVLIAMVAGWVQRHQQQVIAYLSEENRVLKAQLGHRRSRLTDTERRRLATLAHPLGRKRLQRSRRLRPPRRFCAGITTSSRRSSMGASVAHRVVGHQ